MKIVQVADYEAMSDAAADLVMRAMKKNPSVVLGLATGSTPIGLYQRLVAAYQQQEISLANVRSFNLDEYCDLHDSTHSYQYFMDEHLFSHVDIPRDQARVPGCDEEGYENDIRLAGGIDIQILGIGGNGHIGFNEPGSKIDSRTRLVELSPATRTANTRFFGSFDEVPTRAITMGIGTILEARRIVLLASGEGKRQILSDALTGPVTENVPASFLQKHPNVTVVTDCWEE